jgi:methionine synthase II (cobalamin-independent)
VTDPADLDAFVDVERHGDDPGVADTLRKALALVDADKLLLSTNCGMAPLPRDVALAKLSALTACRYRPRDLTAGRH